MLNDSTPTDFAAQLANAATSLWLYRDGCVNENAAGGIREGIDACKTIEEAATEHDGFFVPAELPMRIYLGALQKNHTIAEMFRRAPEIRGRLEGLIDSARQTPQPTDEDYQRMITYFDVLTSHALHFNDAQRRMTEEHERV